MILGSGNGDSVVLEIYTVQISVANQLGLTDDPNYLDVTVKSGNDSFAPTWDMVMSHKRGELSDDGYTDQYYRRMRQSYIDNREDWQALLEQEKVILACYCRAGCFCHRHLLAKMLVQCGGVLMGERRCDAPHRKES